MKICFIAPNAYQLFNENVTPVFGGAEIQLYLLAKEFAKSKEHEIHFMVADHGQNTIEEYDGIKVWKSINFNTGIIRKILNFFLIFNKINADVYIQITATIFSGIMALYCKITGKKFIYMLAHDTEIGGKLFESSQIKKFLFNLVFKFSSKILTQNDYQQTSLSKKDINSHILRSSYPIESGISKSKGEYHLWVARFEDWKRPPLFLKLAKLFPQEQFLMICSKNKDSSESAYMEFIQKTREVSNIKFIEFVPLSEIDYYFQKAKTFINTSTQEGVPTTFIHAGISKTPIISLNVNPDQFLTDYNCGYYCNDNFDCMKESLEKLITDDKLYKEISDNLFNYISKNYDIKNNANKLLAIIQDIK